MSLSFVVFLLAIKFYQKTSLMGYFYSTVQLHFTIGGDFKYKNILRL